eukprot:5914054-Amphidinium_carterae.1
MGGRRSRDRSTARAVTHEHVLKQKNEEKSARKERRAASFSPPRTEVVSPATPPSTAAPTPMIPGASPKRQPKPNLQSSQRMDVEEGDGGTKRARANDSVSVVPPNTTLEDKVDMLLRCMPDLSR